MLRDRGDRKYNDESYLGDVLKAALNPIASVKIPKSLQKANEVALKLSPGGEGIKKAQELLGTDKELSVAPIDLVGLGAGSMAVKGAARGARAVSRASKARTAVKRATFEKARDNAYTVDKFFGKEPGFPKKAEREAIAKLEPASDRAARKIRQKVGAAKYYRGRVGSNIKHPIKEAQDRKWGKLKSASIMARRDLKKADKEWRDSYYTSDEVDGHLSKNYYSKKQASKNSDEVLRDYEQNAMRPIREKVKEAYIGRKHDRYVTKYGNKPKPPSKIRLRRSKTTVRPARVDKTRMEIARQRELEMEDYADQFYAMEARKEKYRELSKQIKQAVKDQDPEKYFAEMRRVLPQVHSGDELDDMLAMLDYEYEQYLAPFFRKMNRNNGPDFGQGPYGDNIVP